MAALASLKVVNEWMNERKTDGHAIGDSSMSSFKEFIGSCKPEGFCLNTRFTQLQTGCLKRCLKVALNKAKVALHALFGPQFSSNQMGLS